MTRKPLDPATLCPSGCDCAVEEGGPRDFGRYHCPRCMRCVPALTLARAAYERGRAEIAAAKEENEAWRALAEWEAVRVFREVHWDASRAFAIDDDADGISAEVASVEFPAGEIDHGRHAIDLASKLGLLKGGEGKADG